MEVEPRQPEVNSVLTESRLFSARCRSPREEPQRWLEVAPSQLGRAEVPLRSPPPLALKEELQEESGSAGAGAGAFPGSPWCQMKQRTPSHSSLTIVLPL